MTDSTDLNGIGAPIELPTPNLPLLRKVLDHIDAHPEEWNQGSYAVRTDCGTAYCIAGHAAVMSGAEAKWYRGTEGTTASQAILPDGSTVGIESYAREALGVTWDEASLLGGLFDCSNTRADVQRHAEAIAARAGERL